MLEFLTGRLRRFLRSRRSLPAGTKFVWSKGFALGADRPGPGAAAYVNGDWRARFPEGRYQGIRAGEVLWVRASDLGRFVSRVLPRIREPFVLVSGDEDVGHPVDPMLDGTRFGLDPGERAAIRSMLEDPRLLAWFAQNAVGEACRSSRGKLRFLPIGLDLHSAYLRGAWGVAEGTPPEVQERDLEAVRRAAAPLDRRRPRVLAAWSNNHSEGCGLHGLLDRRQLAQALTGNPVVDLELGRSWDRMEYWQAMAGYRFVLAPVGHGLDTHRVWEALLLGCIVLVQESAISSGYQDLPVVPIREVADITPGRLADWQREHGEAAASSSDLPEVRMETWWRRIREAAGREGRP